MPDLSVFQRQKTIRDYSMEDAEREFRNQLVQAQLQKAGAVNSGGATGAIADRLIAEGVDPLQAVLIAKSGIGVGNMVDPTTGQVNNMQGILDAVQQRKFAEGVGSNTADYQIKPLIAGAEANARNQSALGFEPKIKQATDLAAGDAERALKLQQESDANKKVLPIIDQLDALNQESPSIPYAGKTQWARRLYPGTSPEESAVDLMRQSRLELAAPLAKQLGVNPTDKDFQASLDRIFDIEASRESRTKQIDALRNRIVTRQSQIDGNAKIMVINPQTGEQARIDQSDLQDALAEGFKRL